jgi:hypothetical protein
LLYRLGGGCEDRSLGARSSLWSRMSPRRMIVLRREDMGSWGWGLGTPGAVYTGFRRGGSWAGALGGGSRGVLEASRDMGPMVRALWA